MFGDFSYCTVVWGWIDIGVVFYGSILYMFICVVIVPCLCYGGVKVE